MDLVGAAVEIISTRCRHRLDAFYSFRIRVNWFHSRAFLLEYLMVTLARDLRGYSYPDTCPILP